MKTRINFYIMDYRITFYTNVDIEIGGVRFKSAEYYFVDEFLKTLNIDRDTLKENITLNLKKFDVEIRKLDLNLGKAVLKGILPKLATDGIDLITKYDIFGIDYQLGERKDNKEFRVRISNDWKIL